ncbi:acyl-CoA dehydrogenase family protein [Streptomyces tauricus]|uniref:acyl-CoA dehydrogenase family protein n=1 Tax=Streptomyces tauricus TaxID=68274 RepID=UPI0022447CB4|nr:acyl-CoA dehydrogenase family protein [Streptomyces tauricus]MCW8103065.1 acyl-CoA dehydrogenase family protein [Streptomyces tauricus]
MAALGGLGTAIPEEYGGAGRGLTDLCLFLQESPYGLAPISGYGPTVISAAAYENFGTEVQKRTVLEGVVEGRVEAVSMSEPGPGSEVGWRSAWGCAWWNAKAGPSHYRGRAGIAARSPSGARGGRPAAARRRRAAAAGLQTTCRRNHGSRGVPAAYPCRTRPAARPAPQDNRATGQPRFRRSHVRPGAAGGRRGFLRPR